MPMRPRSGTSLPVRHKIVRQLLAAGGLECVHLAALRIDAGHHVLDDAVLARRVHALEHQQHCPLAAGVKALLQFGELGDAVGEYRLDVLECGRQAEALGGIVIGELEMPRVIDPAPLDDLGEFHLSLAAMRGALAGLHRR